MPAGGIYPFQRDGSSGAAPSFLWHGVIEGDLDRDILALPARRAPPDGLLSQWREGNAAARRFTKPPKEARS
jgi:hypothetical protein